MVTLTIAIPTYNRSEILRTNLASLEKALRSNNVLDIDVVVIDNGDSSSIAQEYKYIKYIKNNENIGVNGSILKILENNESDYVWIIGDDDYLNSQVFNKVIELIIEKSPDWLILSQNNTTLELYEYSNVNDLIRSNINLQDLIFISINIYKTNIFRSKINKIMDNNNLHMPHFLGVTYSNRINKIIHYKLNPFLKIGVEENIKNMWAPITLWTGSIFDFIFKQDSRMTYKNRIIFLRKMRKDWLNNRNLAWSLYLIKDKSNVDKYLVYKKIASYISIIDGSAKSILTKILIISVLLMPETIKKLSFYLFINKKHR